LHFLEQKPWLFSHSFLFSFVATPLVRRLALTMGWLDAPATSVKTHKVATPALGGIAIWIAFAGTVFVSTAALAAPPHRSTKSARSVGQPR